MDYTCVDVTDVAGASVGDVVTLLGRAGDQTIPVTELSDLAETIPYEILCGIGRRVRRRYHNGSPEGFLGGESGAAARGARAALGELRP